MSFTDFWQGALLVALFVIGGYIALAILVGIWRAIWPKVDVTAAVRKTGELVTKVEDAYREGRGR